MQYQSLWHSVMALFLICVIIAHIYIGSLGMVGAIDAMTTGEVDVNWAQVNIMISGSRKSWQKPGTCSVWRFSVQPAE